MVAPQHHDRVARCWDRFPVHPGLDQALHRRNGLMPDSSEQPVATARAFGCVQSNDSDPACDRPEADRPGRLQDTPEATAPGPVEMVRNTSSARTMAREADRFHMQGKNGLSWLTANCSPTHFVTSQSPPYSSSVASRAAQSVSTYCHGPPTGRFTGLDSGYNVRGNGSSDSLSGKYSSHDFRVDEVVQHLPRPARPITVTGESMLT